ncbi:hypothetical protein ACFOON_12295 [Novosphingobium piscinae]|uniref:Phage shock protein B n=1 Tax=Novosphingobium piscinae TaxID=1507448 RepID=A0A7X1FW04_9SPHN|nr:hypothetical protein [Novosphingobium piscinae]MBC2668003.1 hypothetical protein [Novosphingobium piscinae]
MPEVLALLVPFAPFAMVCFIVWTKHKRKMTELQINQQTHYVAEADAYARLEERIRVLERIVTDRGSDLAAQIEALREEAPALQAQRSAALQQREVQP